MSLPEGVRRVRESIEKTVDVVQEKKQQLEQFKEKVIEKTRPTVDTCAQTSKASRNVFFNLRRRYVWETITGVTTLAAVSGIPFGRFAVLRNALVAGVSCTCVMNPEYVISLFKKEQ